MGIVSGLVNSSNQSAAEIVREMMAEAIDRLGRASSVLTPTLSKENGLLPPSNGIPKELPQTSLKNTNGTQVDYNEVKQGVLVKDGLSNGRSNTDNSSPASQILE